MKVRESIDAKGNYIENAVSGKHVDHGTAVMKGDKACFTSAMSNDGESCWTTHPVKIGHTMLTTNDKGEKLKVTRIAYVKLSMPEIGYSYFLTDVRQAFQLQQRAEREAVGAECAPRRELARRKIWHVDRVERRPVLHVREHNRALDDVAAAQAGGLKRRRRRFPSPAWLGLDPVGQLAVRPDADLT